MSILIGMLVGTGIKINVLVADVTNYSKAETCPNTQCQTASGRIITAEDTDVMACPRRFKLGSRVIMDGKEYICDDRTSKRFDGRFDVWVGTDYQGAMQWGIKNKTLIIY
jgi:3D (Asp-Asp-Asp) domain-containing protein